MVRPPSGRGPALAALAFLTLSAGRPVSAADPTPEDARAFIARADTELLELANKQQRASWVQSNFITQDTEAIAADANRELIAKAMDLAAEAVKYEKVPLSEDEKRKLLLLKLAVIPLPAPRDAAQQKELTEIAARLEAMYGSGKYCRGGGDKDCLDIGAVSRIMASSRKYDELLDVWKGWHAVAPPMKPKYERYVELANAGAKDLGYADLGALWRSNYDMPPDAFAAELDRLWNQVRPLYEALHAHVRAQLVKTYGASHVPADGPIPAHLLGNIWAQQWGNLYPMVAPPGKASYDLTALLKAKKTDEKEMVRYGERFFTSLGFAPLPATFWERSLFVKPKDREVVCHASAWDVDNADDLRIKMCIEINEEDFVTIHHELGHNFYQRAYNKLPYIYRNSANDGFHEAIGDTVALSVTADYLRKVGLLKTPAAAGGDLPYLMNLALEKVAFLPFGLLVDQWRWKVFSGEVTPANYNKAWWDLRLKYQGVAPAVARTEADFDPGAKYHVPANVPYSRYFLAAILQFQLHRALCREAGHQGPLHTCSIYDDKKAGAKLAKMLEMGQSKPWPDALYAVTGERQIDATAMLDYFAPLKTWLDEQNKGRKTGWAGAPVMAPAGAAAPKK